MMFSVRVDLNQVNTQTHKESPFQALPHLVPPCVLWVYLGSPAAVFLNEGWDVTSLTFGTTQKLGAGPFCILILGMQTAV